MPSTIEAQAGNRALFNGDTVQRSSGRQDVSEGGQSSERIRAAVGVYRDGQRMDQALAALADGGVEPGDICLFATVESLRQLYPSGHFRFRIEDQRSAELIPAIEHRANLGPLEGRIDDRLAPVNAFSKTGLILANSARSALFAPFIEPQPVYFGDWLQHYLLARHALNLAEQVDQGAALIWVRLHDEGQEGLICRILLRHNDFRTQVHDLPDVAAGSLATH